jgi:hypothetical protein
MSAHTHLTISFRVWLGLRDLHLANQVWFYFQALKATLSQHLADASWPFCLSVVSSRITSVHLQIPGLGQPSHQTRWTVPHTNSTHYFIVGLLACPNSTTLELFAGKASSLVAFIFYACFFAFVTPPVLLSRLPTPTEKLSSSNDLEGHRAAAWTFGALMRSPK